MSSVNFLIEEEQQKYNKIYINKDKVQTGNITYIFHKVIQFLKKYQMLKEFPIKAFPETVLA